MKTRHCTFVVEGKFPFPVDMLRYDTCHPTDTESCNAIAASLGVGTGPTHTVRLEANHLPLGPTDKRWASFGWHVTQVNDMDAASWYLREPA